MYYFISLRRLPCDVELCQSRHPSKHTDAHVWEARVLQTPVNGQGQVSSVDDSVDPDALLLGLQLFELGLVHCLVRRLACLLGLDVCGLDLGLDALDAVLVQAVLLREVDELQDDIGGPEAAGPERDLVGGVHRDRDDLMGPQPVDVLERVVDQVANVLEAVDEEEELAGRRVVVDVLHPLYQRQEAYIMQGGGLKTDVSWRQ